MTDTAPRAAAPAVDAEGPAPDAADGRADDTDGTSRARASRRGGFEIFRAPEMTKVPTPEVMASVPDMSAAADAFDYADLVDEDHDEAEVREAVGEMARAIASGSKTTPLFGQGGPDGMSLVHAWFGPNFPLFRHSHPRYGDCLYYVIAGEVILGSQRLGPGDGFFVPNEMPYKYKAGPEGVEVLEFRAGGGIKGGAALKLAERDVDAIRRLTELATAEHEGWKDAPTAPGGALYQP